MEIMIKKKKKTQSGRYRTSPINRTFLWDHVRLQNYYHHVLVGISV